MILRGRRRMMTVATPERPGKKRPLLPRNWTREERSRPRHSADLIRIGLVKSGEAFVCGLTLVIALAVVMAPLASAEKVSIHVGPNVDIAGEALPDREIVEPGIAVDPRNPDIVAAAAEDANTVPAGGCFSSARCHMWPVYFRSTDGGKKWSSRLLPGFPGDTSPQGLASPLQNFSHVGHVSVAFDRSGNVYYSGFVANFDSSGFIRSSTRIVVIKFANDGADYVGATVLPTSTAGIGGSVAFPRMAVDTSGGPNDGTVYLTFVDFANDGYTSFFTRSMDGGVTFSKAILIPGGVLSVAPVVDPTGNVFVESVHCTGGLVCSPGTLAVIQVAKSVDAGLTFGKPVTAATVTPDPTPFPGNAFVSEFLTGISWHIAADDHGVYIVWDDFATGNANVLFSESTDGGVSWSTPIVVNDVTRGQQFLPEVAVSVGIISVVWYDSRLGQLANGTITSLDVFYAESTDGGSTFSTSVRVTSISFDPNLVERGDIAGPAFIPFIGDRIGLAASPTVVHAIWTDNRNGCDTIDPTFGCVDQDVFVAEITP